MAIPDLLRELAAADTQLAHLESRRRDLRQELVAALVEDQRFELDLAPDLRVSVSRSTTQRVDYDEPRLRQRLGDRYRLILAPDLTKIRRHLDLVAPHLAPVIETVGSPDRDLVKARIQEGTLTKEQFADCFTKSRRSSLVIRYRGAGAPWRGAATDQEPGP